MIHTFPKVSSSHNSTSEPDAKHLIEFGMMWGYFPSVVIVRAGRMENHCWPGSVPEVLELTGWTTQNFLVNDCAMYSVGAVIRTAYQECPGLQVLSVCIWTGGQSYCQSCYRCSWVLSCLTSTGINISADKMLNVNGNVTENCSEGVLSVIHECLLYSYENSWIFWKIKFL